MESKDKRTTVPDTAAMTTSFESSDLLTHMHKLISTKVDMQSASLVCKGWKEVSDAKRRASLHVTDDNGAHLELIRYR